MAVQGAKVYSGLYNGNIQVWHTDAYANLPTTSTYCLLLLTNYSYILTTAAGVAHGRVRQLTQYSYLLTAAAGVAHGRVRQLTLRLAARVPHLDGPRLVHLLPTRHRPTTHLGGARQSHKGARRWW